MGRHRHRREFASRSQAIDQMSEYTRRCSVHGTYTDYSSEGCPECRLAETELRSEVALAAYKGANPGDYECPHCRYVSLKAGASRCPLCHGEVGSNYWSAEAKRQEARKAEAVLAERAAAEVKRSAAAAERVAFDRATLAIRGRLLAFALVVAAVWWGLRQYSIWLPAVHPKWLGTTLAVLSGNVGATLGATIVFLGFAFVVPRFTRAGAAFVVILLLYAVELSKLYHAHWIDDIRLTGIGGLVFGHGFKWTNLICFMIGVSPLAEEEQGQAFSQLLLTLICCAGLVALWRFLLEAWQNYFR